MSDSLCYSSNAIAGRLPGMPRTGPAPFIGLRSSPIYACRSCGAELTASPNAAEDVQRKSDIQAIEDAYRAMLLGVAPHPALLGRATDQAFRQFVEDMLQLLTRNLNPYCSWQTGSPAPFSRRDILQIITALIGNAAPSSDRRIRSHRYSRGLVLWAALLGIISELEGDILERSSCRWPASLQRRFLCAPGITVSRNVGRTHPIGPLAASELSIGRSPRCTACTRPSRARFKPSPPARGARNLTVTRRPPTLRCLRDPGALHNPVRDLSARNWLQTQIPGFKCSATASPSDPSPLTAPPPLRCVKCPRCTSCKTFNRSRSLVLIASISCFLIPPV